MFLTNYFTTCSIIINTDCEILSSIELDIILYEDVIGWPQEQAAIKIDE